MAVNLEDAGFEIRDQIVWLYGSGFPKSLNIGKAIDAIGANVDLKDDKIRLAKHIREKRKCANVSVREMASWFPYSEVTKNWERLDAGNRTPSVQDYEILIDRLGCSSEYLSLVKEVAEREVICQHPNPARSVDGVFSRETCGFNADEVFITAPATPEAAEWQGWGTALKPAVEPVVLARKPLAEDTVAANVLKYRTGGINVDGCRVETTDNLNGGAYAKNGQERHDGAENWRYKREGDAGEYVQPSGRFHANVILDEDAGEDVQTGSLGSSYRPNRLDGQYAFSTNSEIYGTFQQDGKKSSMIHADSGGASRFFYSAKASKKERRESKHPTVKPLALMRYLCRLITPKNGIVLDPFAGSGTTGEAAVLEGFHPIMIEMEADYVKDIENRMAAVNGETESDLAMMPRATASLDSLFVD